MFPLYDDQPTRRTPYATIAIILLNVLVFVFWQSGAGVDRTVIQAGFIPEEFTEHEPGAMTHVFTSMFMHAGWWHLLGNMWFLWIFGKNIEDVCGHFRFVCFYLLRGAAATFLYTVGSPHSDIPLVGASGAISGVLGAFLLKFPKAKIRTVSLVVFIRILDLPAYVFLLIWIGFQAYQHAASRSAGETSGVAYLAHIGGFIAGIALIFIFQDSQPAPRQEPDDAW
jgi:membrane associated rhomboid family serine protease